MKRYLPTTLILILIALLLTQTACATLAPPPTTAPAANDTPSEMPAAVEYDLGEATIVQAGFPEDSPFRNMPVRLNGLIAVPPEDVGPYPVVVILHGTHPGCPVDENKVDRWPCAPEAEQPNYQGFGYLVSRLAAEGYVALSLNINAENTFGFGEPVPGERLAQLFDLHLSALSAAAAGGANDFGVELNGRADMRRLALFGHSRGGDFALWLANSNGLAAPDAFDKFGYGPVTGALLIAPAVFFNVPASSALPFAVLLSACDGDLISQEGQYFIEGARLDPSQREWMASVWLEGANHNAFNTLLPPDLSQQQNRPDCATLLEGDAQRDFLSDYAVDFLTLLFSTDAQAVREAEARQGWDVQAPAPAELYGLPARVATFSAAADRRTLLVPAGAGELTTNLAGGDVIADGVGTFFCEAGYYTPFVKPGSEPCKRVNLIIPGNPAMLVVSWEQQGALLRLTLPAGEGDLSGYTTLSLRAGVDPISPLNAPGSPQALSVRLTDASGAVAEAQTRPDEPALGFPPGVVEEDPVFEGGLFSGRVPLMTVRIPLSDFEGVDLSSIREVALLFDQTPSGSLFMADLEWVRPSHGE